MTAQLIRDHPEAHNWCAPRGTLPHIIAPGGLEMLEAAFAAGLSPDAGQDATDSQTFLQHAVAGGELDLVDLCLRHGANLDKRNASGETALGYACSWGQLAVVKRLVEAGADVNAIEHDRVDDFRNTALDCCSRQPEIAAFLRSKGAKHINELDV